MNAIRNPKKNNVANNQKPATITFIQTGGIHD